MIRVAPAAGTVPPAPAGTAPRPWRSRRPTAADAYLQLGDRLGAPARADVSPARADSPGHLAAADEASPCCRRRRPRPAASPTPTPTPTPAPTPTPTPAAPTPARRGAGCRRPWAHARDGRRAADRRAAARSSRAPPVVEPPTERTERPKRDKSFPSALVRRRRGRSSLRLRCRPPPSSPRPTTTATASGDDDPNVVA